MLAVASDDGGCKILNSTTGSLIVELLNTTTDILAIAWAGDSSKVILSTGAIEVQWFHTSNWTHEMTLSNLPSWTSGIDSTPDGRLIFFSTNNNLRGYWTTNGTMYLNMTNHTEYIRSVVVSPDGRYVATGSNDNNVKITDIATKTVVATVWAGSLRY